MDWRAFAACVAAIRRGEADQSWWFPSRGAAANPGGSYGKARAICSGCPVRSSCLEDALAYERASIGEPVGMFGGLSGQERARLVRGQRINEPALRSLRR